MSEDALQLGLLQDQIVRLWEESLKSAYSFAKGEVMQTFTGRRIGYYDGRGLNPFSEQMGRVQALEALLPFLLELSVSPAELKDAARQDALAEIREQVKEEVAA